MNKRTLIILASVAAAALLGIAVAVCVLFSEPSSHQKKQHHRASRLELLQAVPTDAAAVMICHDFEEIVDIFDGDFSSFVKEISASSEMVEMSSSTVVSLHYSGSLVPLFATLVKGDPADSLSLPGRLSSLASSRGFHKSMLEFGGRSLFLASPSQTILESSLRHMESGSSIADNEDFADCRDKSGVDNAFFVNLRYLDRFKNPLSSVKMGSYYSFLKHFSSWVAVSFAKGSSSLSGNFSFKVMPYSKNTKASFARVLDSQKPVTSTVAEIAPSSTDGIVSLPFSSVSNYLDAYERYLDSVSELDRYKSALSADRKKFGKSLREWVETSISPSELSRIRWTSEDGLHYEVIAYKGSDFTISGCNAADCAKYISDLFGKFFSMKGELSSLNAAGWVVIGSREALQDFAASDYKLRNLASSAGRQSSLSKKTSLLIYHNLLQEYASSGASFYALTATYSDSAISAETAAVQVMEKGEGTSKVVVAKIEVPDGPFTVYNSGTGRDCLLRQNANLSLSLAETSGKGIWSIPFTGKLCGMVECIDYYANDKKQFLFCSGSSVYLLDRLGRFVSGFPVKLEKEVLLGPVAFDFTGAKGYNIMVLHTDNTIGLYNLKGQVPEKWEGITAEDTIVSVPELVKVKGKSWWVLRTARETLVFPFYGGEPRTTGKGNKAIKGDSDIVATDSGIRVTCIDGKERLLKL